MKQTQQLRVTRECGQLLTLSKPKTLFRRTRTHAPPLAFIQMTLKDDRQNQLDRGINVKRNQWPRHLLQPTVRYRIDDRDGDAVAGDGYRLQLSYIFLGQGFTVASNVAVGSHGYDEANPIYGVKTDSDLFAVDTTVLYRLPTESGRWQLVGHLLWGEDDSDVDFHDNQVFMVSLGAMYRFGQR